MLDFLIGFLFLLGYEVLSLPLRLALQPVPMAADVRRLISRVAGPAVIVFTSWVMGHFGIRLHIVTIWGWWIVFMGGAWGLCRAQGQHAEWARLVNPVSDSRHPWRDLGIELFSLFIFFSYLAFRRVAPEMTVTTINGSGSEKFNNATFFWSSWFATSLPPEDYWLSGHPQAYYYYGQFFWAWIGRFSFMKAEWVITLGMSRLVLLIWESSFLLIRSFGLRRASACFGALVITWGGNPYAVQKFKAHYEIQVGRFNELEDQKEFILAKKYLDKVKPTTRTYLDPKGGKHDITIGRWASLCGGYGFWDPSRALRGEDITEFAAWTAILGDFHAHHLSLPWMIAFIALVLSGERWFKLRRAPAGARREDEEDYDFETEDEAEDEPESEDEVEAEDETPADSEDDVEMITNSPKNTASHRKGKKNRKKSSGGAGDRTKAADSGAKGATRKDADSKDKPAKASGEETASPSENRADSDFDGTGEKRGSKSKSRNTSGRPERAARVYQHADVYAGRTAFTIRLLLWFACFLVLGVTCTIANFWALPLTMASALGILLWRLRRGLFPVLLRVVFIVALGASIMGGKYLMTSTLETPLVRPEPPADATKIERIMHKSPLQVLPGDIRSTMDMIWRHWGFHLVPLMALVVVFWIRWRRHGLGTVAPFPIIGAIVGAVGILAVWRLQAKTETALFWLILLLCFAAHFAGSRPWLRPRVTLYICLTFVLLGCLEIFFMDDAYAGSYERYNTYFKFSYPAWVIMGAAAWLACHRIWHWNVNFAVRWPLRLAMLAALPFVFTMTLAGMPARLMQATHGEKWPRRPTLDAFSWLQYVRGYESENAMLKWIRENVPPRERMAEAVYARSQKGSYGYVGRVASLAGRPVPIGWEHHEHQWRGFSSGEVNSNHDKVRELYNARDGETLRRVAKDLGLHLVVLGKTEVDALGDVRAEAFYQMISKEARIIALFPQSDPPSMIFDLDLPPVPGPPEEPAAAAAPGEAAGNGTGPVQVVAPQ